MSRLNFHILGLGLNMLGSLLLVLRWQPPTLMITIGVVADVLHCYAAAACAPLICNVLLPLVLCVVVFAHVCCVSSAAAAAAAAACVAPRASGPGRVFGPQQQLHPRAWNE